MVLNPEGRAVWNSSTSKWEFEYDVKDHLGNTRASFAPTTDKVKVLQTRDYYPFGMLERSGNPAMAGEQASWYVNDANATKFRYNGKELQDEGGLGWYDYGARFYDPELGRFHSLDPKAELFSSQSQFGYAANNPILFIDLNGENAWKPKGDGTWTAEKGDGAETLAQDAGISKEKAYSIMAEQGYGTYVDKNDGIIKSAVDVGDVVDINSKEIADTKNEISTNEVKIESNIRKIDSLNKVGEKNLAISKAAEGVIKEASTDGPNQAGTRFGYGILSNKHNSKAQEAFNKSESLSKQTDSLKSVNKDLKEKIK